MSDELPSGNVIVDSLEDLADYDQVVTYIELSFINKDKTPLFTLTALDSYGLKLAEWQYHIDSVSSIENVYVEMNSLDTENVVVYRRKRIISSVFNTSSVNNNKIIQVSSTGVNYLQDNLTLNTMIQNTPQQFDTGKHSLQDINLLVTQVVETKQILLGDDQDKG